MRSVMKVDSKSCSQEMRSKLGILTLFNRRRFSLSVLTFKIVLDVNCPDQLRFYLSFRCNIHSRNLHDNTLRHLPKVCSKTGQTAFQYAAVADWNSFLRSVKEIGSIPRFKSAYLNILVNEISPATAAYVNVIST